MKESVLFVLCCVLLVNVWSLLTSRRYMRFTADEFQDIENISSEQNEKFVLNGMLIQSKVTTWTEEEYWLDYSAVSENTDLDALINKVSVFLLCDGEYIPLLKDKEVDRKLHYFYNLETYLGPTVEFYIDTDKLDIDDIKRRKIKGLKVVTNVTVDGDTKNIESTYTSKDVVISGLTSWIYSVPDAWREGLSYPG
jgi:hypothetical protein